LINKLRLSRYKISSVELLGPNDLIETYLTSALLGISKPEYLFKICGALFIKILVFSFLDSLVKKEKTP